MTSAAWLTVLLDASAKSAVVLALAALAAFAMRRASAAVRHLIWTLAIAAVLCLPVLSLLLPAWPVLRIPAILGAPASPPPESFAQEIPEASPPPLQLTTLPSTNSPQPRSDMHPPTEPVASPPRASRTSRSLAAQPVAVGPARSIPSILLLIWFLGASVALLPLLVGIVAVSRLARQAHSWTDPSLLELLRATAAQLSLRRPPTLLRSSHSTVPMMSGLLRPLLLLPAAATAWPPERRRLVFLHELAHVKRGDYLSQILAHLATAVYWFNPLAWLALYSLRREGQRACDDLVLNTGFRPSDYAQHLLDIARGAQGAGFCSTAAVPMAQPGKLEGRVRAILDARRSRRGVTRPGALLAVLAVAATVIPLARVHAFPAPTRLGEGPGGRTLYHWNPSESRPGGAQHDPRLEQPVRFFGAGLALSDVFSSLEEETGVKLDFWPPGDQNARVRVNLYLNREEPPKLRELMAQLMWVTDCTFAYAEPTAGEKGPTYYLLRTSIAEGVPRAPAVLERRAEERAGSAGPRSSPRDFETRKLVVRENVEELRQALALSREELIARYRGVNDYLLFILTNPRWRAGAEYLCGAIGSDFDPSTSTGSSANWWSKREWSDLNENERSLVARYTRFRKAEWDLINSTEVEVWIEFHDDRLILSVAALVEPPGGWLGVGAYYRPGLAPTPERASLEMERWSASTIARCLRRIGENVPQGQEEAAADRWKASLAKQRRELDLRAQARGGLSPATADLLASLALPVEPGRPYALWELQGAVAASSGLNVVSDCFWQPRRPLRDAQSALLALASAARAWPGETRNLLEREWMAGWEWQDAGSFLRFRSIDRDLWRASILPADVLAEVDELIHPYLPEVEERECPPEGFSLQVETDPLALIRIGSRLDDLQLAYGGLLLYEDPADPIAACRHALREAVLDLLCNQSGHRPSDARNVTRAVEAFRVIASLSDGQWEGVQTTGGLPGDQLTDEQLERASKAIAFWDVYQDRVHTLRLKAGDRTSDSPRHSGRPLWFYVTLVKPKEAHQYVETVPEADRRDLNLFQWICDYRLDVRVGHPLLPARTGPESE